MAPQPCGWGPVVPRSRQRPRRSLRAGMALTIVAQIRAAPTVVRPETLNAVADRVAGRCHLRLDGTVTLPVSGWGIATPVTAVTGRRVVPAIISVVESAVTIAQSSASEAETDAQPQAAIAIAASAVAPPAEPSVASEACSADPTAPEAPASTEAATRESAATEAIAAEPTSEAATCYATPEAATAEPAPVEPTASEAAAVEPAPTEAAARIGARRKYHQRPEDDGGRQECLLHRALPIEDKYFFRSDNAPSGK